MQEDEQEDHRILHLFGNNTSSDIDSVLENLDQDVWDQIVELSSGHSSAENQERIYFSDLTDVLLKKTAEISKEKRENYVKKAYEFWEILEGYNDSFFARNFFGYLFDKTEDFENKQKKEFVLCAKFVYDCVFYPLYERFEEEVSPESLISKIRPDSNLKEHLGFEKKDYDILIEELKIRKCIDFEDKKLYKKEKVSDFVEYIDEKRKISNLLKD